MHTITMWNHGMSMVELDGEGAQFTIELKGARGFLKPPKRLSCLPHAAITSCSVFVCIFIYPFVAAIVVYVHKDHAERKNRAE